MNYLAEDDQLGEVIIFDNNMQKFLVLKKEFSGKKIVRIYSNCCKLILSFRYKFFCRIEILHQDLPKKITLSRAQFTYFMNVDGQILEIRRSFFFQPDKLLKNSLEIGEVKTKFLLKKDMVSHKINFFQENEYNFYSLLLYLIIFYSE